MYHWNPISTYLVNEVAYEKGISFLFRDFFDILGVNADGANSGANIIGNPDFEFGRGCENLQLSGERR